MPMRLIAVVLWLALASPASVATAAPAPKSSEQVPHPCKGAFDKFCAGKVVCGKGACHDCLNEHMSDLDRACSKAMQKWDEKQERR